MRAFTGALGNGVVFLENEVSLSYNIGLTKLKFERLNLESKVAEFSMHWE